MATTQTLYVMEAANLIVGDTGGNSAPGISTHLVLSELKLPTLEENTQDHTPGGAMIGIEVPSHINKLEATFNLAGWDDKVMTKIGSEEWTNQRFTAYGLIRDRRTAAALQATAIMHGRLGRVNPTAFSKGTLMHHEYSIKSIVHYELTIEDADNAQLQQIYYWDFFTSERRIGGLDLNKDLVRLLAIPANSTDTTNAPAGIAQPGG